MIGTHLVTLYPVGGGPAVDLTCLCSQVTIRHGRQETTAQPEASTCTLELDLTLTMLPATVDVGAALVVSTTPPGGVSSTRFVGRVTDVALGWEDAGEDTPDAGTGQVVAASVLADLGRRVVGAEPWPQEVDGARVSRVLTLAGVVVDPLLVDPGTVQVVPRDVDAAAALEVVQATAVSASGVLWETRDGRVAYADAEHRRNLPSKITIDACQILVTPAWQRSTQGLINKVTIAYGVPPEGGEQPTIAGQADPSIARFGTWDYSLTTELARLSDAQALAGLLLARNARPVWLMTSLPVDVGDLDAASTATVLKLEMHDLVMLTGLPLVGSAPTTASLWVEGWTETLAAGSHDLELDVSGYCRTVPAPRWDDVPPAWTWDTVPASITWDSSTCLEPPTDLGRWNDVAASLRWDLVAPATTWDTWPSTLNPATETEAQWRSLVTATPTP